MYLIKRDVLSSGLLCMTLAPSIHLFHGSRLFHIPHLFNTVSSAAQPGPAGGRALLGARGLESTGDLDHFFLRTQRKGRRRGRNGRSEDLQVRRPTFATFGMKKCTGVILWMLTKVLDRIKATSCHIAFAWSFSGSLGYPIHKIELHILPVGSVTVMTKRVVQ